MTKSITFKDEPQLFEVESTYFPDSKSQEILEEGWKNAIKFMNNKNHKFYNGNLLRFESISKNKIRFSRGITFKDVVGIRNTKSDLYELSKNSLPISITSMGLIIHNKKIILRNRNDGDWKKYIEISGGFLRETDNSLKESVYNRLNEDFKLEKNDFKSIVYYNLFFFPEICETISVYILEIKDEALNRIKKEFNIKKVNKFEEIVNEVKKVHPPSYEIVKQYFLENDRLSENN